MAGAARRVLLLGSTGFLGRHIRDALARDGTTLSCPTRDRCDLIEMSPEALTDLVRRERPSAVVNCAGRITGTGYDFLRAHPLVTAKLIDALLAAAPEARLVRIGSAAEYGWVPDGHLVTEDQPALPVSEYGLSQLTATRLVELAAADRGLDAVVLRVFNPVGPGLPTGNLLGRACSLIRAARDRDEQQIELSMPDSHRDFVDVRDVAAAVRAALHRPALISRVYNVASGRAVATREAVRLLAEQAGFTGGYRLGSDTPAAGRSSAVPWMCGDVSRAERELDWVPRHRLVDSLAALWSAAPSRVGAIPQPAPG
ncbi:NAD-dependent epimerase/dehydratase family protein [Micromonospora sp. NPDC005305]|uniref:NAD-dependent epimerase/dehydratase family protein n=1 Tax=Micromonospora sp. NPDC005305 TaxID=3156875 RepID=UPI0033B07E5A